MSRSYKKTPIVPNTCIGDKAGVQKRWKKGCNKTLRDEEDLPNGSAYKKIGGDIWDSPSDGKHYWKDEKAKRK